MRAFLRGSSVVRRHHVVARHGVPVVRRLMIASSHSFSSTGWHLDLVTCENRAFPKHSQTFAGKLWCIVRRNVSSPREQSIHRWPTHAGPWKPFQWETNCRLSTYGRGHENGPPCRESKIQKRIPRLRLAVFFLFFFLKFVLVCSRERLGQRRLVLWPGCTRHLWMVGKMMTRGTMVTVVEFFLKSVAYSRLFSGWLAAGAGSLLQGFNNGRRNCYRGGVR